MLNFGQCYEQCLNGAAPCYQENLLEYIMSHAQVIVSKTFCRPECLSKIACDGDCAFGVAAPTAVEHSNFGFKTLQFHRYFQKRFGNLSF